MNEWINSKEKLPNHMQLVLASDQKTVAVAYVIHTDEMKKVFDENQDLLKQVLKKNNISEEDMKEEEKRYQDFPVVFASIENKGNAFANITHWMPLPSLPKKENQ